MTSDQIAASMLSVDTASGERCFHDWLTAVTGQLTLLLSPRESVPTTVDQARLGCSSGLEEMDSSIPGSVRSLRMQKAPNSRYIDSCVAFV